MSPEISIAIWLDDAEIADAVAVERPDGDRTVHESVTCAQQNIACCYENETCVEQEEVDCIAAGGSPQPEGSDCGTTSCSIGACCADR